MRLFKGNRSCATKTKSDPTTADESQKSWYIFRLFQGNGGSVLSSREHVSVSGTMVIEDSASRHPPGADSAEDCCSPLTYGNQNYTPEVALSPNALPMIPAVLPLESHNNVTRSGGCGGGGGGAVGSGGGGGDSEAKAKELERYENWQRLKPRFHFGPRGLEDEEDCEGESERRDSASSAAGSENIITLPAKFAFIHQDGKFVEREVTRWPKQPRQVPHLRYRLMEPYASHYGRRYRIRVSSEEHIQSQRHRFIYQNPIYMLPRRIMEENKSRLMIRHSLKNSFEGSKASSGPQKIDIGDKLQSKIVKGMQDKYYQKESEKLVNYMAVKNKSKAT